MNLIDKLCKKCHVFDAAGEYDTEKNPAIFVDDLRKAMPEIVDGLMNLKRYPLQSWSDEYFNKGIDDAIAYLTQPTGEERRHD